MIVPNHWAEARRQHKTSSRQITVRRFGWSIDSETDAKAMAEQRAEEALAAILAGKLLNRREKKAAYNGAEGVPIREEVLVRVGETVITRNAYGAHCLNTPHVLFADIDFASTTPRRWTAVAMLALIVTSLLAGWWMQSTTIALTGAFASLLLAYALAAGVHSLWVATQGGREAMARQRLSTYLTHHPQWAVRVYRTPAGLRVLATHKTFSANATEVQDFFAAIGTDPVYMRMSINQRCFRARLTAKPWRIGMESHMRPRPGIWPVKPEHLPVRQTWIDRYEAKASAFSACRFVESLGSGAEHIDVMPVVELHDRETRALRQGMAIA
jgi:hypothetical protein